VTCEDPEELRWLLQTLSAHAFNFAMTDVGVGVHDVVVEARARANVNFDVGDALAGAEAFAGAGSMLVEEGHEAPMRFRGPLEKRGCGQ
jgi:hypothetical protein